LRASLHLFEVCYQSISSWGTTTHVGAHLEFCRTVPRIRQVNAAIYKCGSPDPKGFRSSNSHGETQWHSSSNCQGPPNRINYLTQVVIDRHAHKSGSIPVSSTILPFKINDLQQKSRRDKNHKDNGSNRLQTRECVTEGYLPFAIRESRI
jgi:hypothetical protein